MTRSQLPRHGLMPLAGALVVLLSACGSPPERSARTLPAGASPECEGEERLDRRPRLISGRAPVFPLTVGLGNKDQALQAPGESREVVTSFTIGVDGTTSEVSSTRTDPDVYARHANHAVLRWRFEPAIRDGEPVAVRCSHWFGFEFGR
jgi:hypothetical protein